MPHCKDQSSPYFTCMLHLPFIFNHLYCTDDTRAQSLFSGNGNGNERWGCTEYFLARKTPLTRLGFSHVWNNMGVTLRVIDLQESIAVDDNSLRDLSTSCRLVKELSLAGCCLVTSRGIKHVAQHCMALESLVLNQCLQITDVSPILRDCKELCALNLRACGNITDESFLRGLESDNGIHNLRALGLRSCFNLTGGAVQRVLLG